MKNKRDILNDIQAGKTTKCCENCKYFKQSQSKIADTMHGYCLSSIDNTFCFNFEICDDYLEK